MAHGLLNGMASWDLALWFLLSALLYSTIGQTVPRFELEPEFLAPLENHTVTQGRDVSFTCVVNHLQSYKVAWIKSDSRAILAMHTHMVAPNPRLSVTHNGHNTWKLHVVNVQPDDSGTYMCQVNTDPMRSQIGHMKVVIPPDIMDLDDSIDRLTSLENGDVRLRCRATGNPKPEVTWRREDGRSIILRTENGRHVAVKTHKSEQLHLTGIQRQEMGSYLCIASNGVPPSVSKRYYVNVLCVKVTLDERRIITENAVNDYTYQINLTIRRVRFSDFSTYTCFTENSFGKTNAIIRLKEKQNIKATSNPHVSRKKPAINSPIKGRKSHNGMNSINDPELSDKTRFEASFKDELSSLNDEDEENDEDEDGMPKHLDAKYSNFPAAPGAHYGSTDFPGSQYFNGATSTTGRFREAIAGCLAIFSLLVR